MKNATAYAALIAITLLHPFVIVLLVRLVGAIDATIHHTP